MVVSIPGDVVPTASNHLPKTPRSGTLDQTCPSLHATVHPSAPQAEETPNSMDSDQIFMTGVYRIDAPLAKNSQKCRGSSAREGLARGRTTRLRQKGCAKSRARVQKKCKVASSGPPRSSRSRIGKPDGVQRAQKHLRTELPVAGSILGVRTNTQMVFFSDRGPPKAPFPVHPALP